VTEHASACGELGVAGHLALADLDVVAAGQRRVHAERSQRIDHWLRKLRKVVERLAVVLRDEAEVQVPQVMIHSAAAG